MLRIACFAFFVLLAACPGEVSNFDAGAAADSGSGAPDGSEPDAGPVDAGPSDAGPSDAGPSDAGPADAGPGDAGIDAGPVVDLCPVGEKRCLAHDRRRYCGATSAGRRFLEETCAAGSGCVQGACVAGACSDDCNFGDSDGGTNCELLDVASASWTKLDAGAFLHDRSRDYNRWLRRDGMASGGVGSARYSNPPTYTVLESMNGIGDSAIWTGTYLAAEALRLSATGSADARANVLDLVARLHLWVSVSGSPGNLARFARLSSVTSPFTIGDLDCANQRVHCGVAYQGANYDYIGHVSRDQYQGVVLGYSLAFDALGSEDAATKDVLRADMVALVKELMKERQVPLSLTINGVKMPTSTVNARFMVVNPAEMAAGALDLNVSVSGGTGDMWGFQEFYPDLADLVHEVPGLSWVPALPRPSSAIMLASFFRVALRMTENDPRFTADHATLLAYYTGHSGAGGNVADWLTIAKQWSGSTACNQSYFANNITFEPLYNLARLEDDPVRRADIHDNLFTAKLWPSFASTKNPFFSFIYAGTVSGVPASVVSIAATQLGQFPPPPRVRFPVDLRADARYPHDATCADQVDHSTAVDVGDRVVGDFLWQRDPWQLFDPGDVWQTEPGVDYLVAYWLGRRHGFLADDTPGRCLARH